MLRSRGDFLYDSETLAVQQKKIKNSHDAKKKAFESGLETVYDPQIRFWKGINSV